MTNFYDFEHPAIDGTPQRFDAYRGKVAIVVNVASKCGLTPHYGGLESLYQERRDDGVVVLGFPCNQFGGQEPGTEDEIRQFCTSRYDVSFPMFSKLEVKGEARHPLYAWLTSQDTSPDGSGDVAWNFAKFVIGKDGEVVARFAPTTKPDDPALRQAIDAAL